ncbi:MAG: ATP-binding cassette domain-containing protein [SAR324 cluster bacterium]|nr:ATP-binding cassette domain-containing protein [SAR324 cluster bacterium]
MIFLYFGLSNLLKGHHIEKGQGIDSDFVLEQFVRLEEGYLQKYPTQISGGQRQRFSLGRAILANAPIMFADEPTAALDTYSANIILQRLRDWCQALPEERCVILICHDVDLAYKYGDNFWLLSPVEWPKSNSTGESRLQGRHLSFLRKSDGHPNLKEWIQHAISLSKRQQASIGLSEEHQKQLVYQDTHEQKIKEPPVSFCYQYAKNDIFPNRELKLPNQALVQTISFMLFFTISFLLIGFLKGSEQAQIEELEKSSFLRLRVSPSEKYPTFTQGTMTQLNSMQRRGNEFVLPTVSQNNPQQNQNSGAVNVKGQNEIHLQFLTSDQRTLRGVGQTVSIEDPIQGILMRQQHLTQWFAKPRPVDPHQMIVTNSFLTSRLGYILPETFPDLLSTFKKFKQHKQPTDRFEQEIVKIVRRVLEVSNKTPELNVLLTQEPEYRFIDQYAQYQFVTNLSKILSDSTDYVKGLAFIESQSFQNILNTHVVQNPKQLELRIQRYSYYVAILDRIEELPDNKDFIVLEEFFLDYNRQILIKPQRFGQITLTIPSDKWNEDILRNLVHKFRCDSYLHPDCSMETNNSQIMLMDYLENQDEILLTIGRISEDIPLIPKEYWQDILQMIETLTGKLDPLWIAWEYPEELDLEPQPYSAGEYQQLVVYVDKLDDVIPVVQLLKRPDLDFNVAGDVISDITNLQKMTNLFALVTAIIIGSLVLLASFNFWISCKIHIERKYSDIGLLISFGGSNQSILNIFLIETSILFFVAFIGSLASTLILSTLISLMIQQTHLDLSFTYWTPHYLLPVILGMISMYLPTFRLVKKALKENPANLLKM